MTAAAGPTPAPPLAVLLDLDGTRRDSTALIIAAFAEVRAPRAGAWGGREDWRRAGANTLA